MFSNSNCSCAQNTHWLVSPVMGTPVVRAGVMCGEAEEDEAGRRNFGEHTLVLALATPAFAAAARVDADDARLSPLLRFLATERQNARNGASHCAHRQNGPLSLSPSALASIESSHSVSWIRAVVTPSAPFCEPGCANFIAPTLSHAGFRQGCPPEHVGGPFRDFSPFPGHSERPVPVLSDA